MEQDEIKFFNKEVQGEAKRKRISRESYFVSLEWLDDGQRSIFQQNICSIKSILEKIDNAQKKEIKRLEEIGKLAQLLIKMLKQFNIGRKGPDRISTQFFLNYFFNKNSNRIYEAIAFKRALNAKAPSTWNQTTLIKVGEKLGNNSARKKLETILAKGQVLINDELISLNAVSEKDFLNTIRFFGTKNESATAAQQKIDSLHRNLRRILSEIHSLTLKYQHEISQNRSARISLLNLDTYFSDGKTALKKISKLPSNKSWSNIKTEEEHEESLCEREERKSKWQTI